MNPRLWNFSRVTLSNHSNPTIGNNEQFSQVLESSAPDILDDQNDEYATMKFRPDRPRAFTASDYAGNNETPMLDQLHKNDLLHRSMTALQEYAEAFDHSVPHATENHLSSSVSIAHLIFFTSLYWQQVP